MDRTNSALFADLRKKLGTSGVPVSRQAVEQRRARVQKLVPMPTDVATYIVAQRAGMKLHSYLDEAKLDQVATWEQRLAAKENGASLALASQGTSKPALSKTVVKELHLDTIKVPDAALSARRKGEAERMAGIYPLLYAFENSVREFIDGHLSAQLGRDWFEDPKVASSSVRGTVRRNKEAEGRHRYHSSRSARPIDYTNIDDLGTIVQSERGWPVFKPIFPSDKWLPGIIEKIENSRNVVAHMNPLQRRDIVRIKVNFEDWLEQIKGHEPPSIQ